MENCEDGICAEDFKVPLGNIVKENEERTEKIWTKETKIGPGKINWRALAVEFTWKNIWTKRDWKEIGKHFLFVFPDLLHQQIINFFVVARFVKFSLITLVFTFTTHKFALEYRILS